MKDINVVARGLDIGSFVKYMHAEGLITSPDQGDKSILFKIDPANISEESHILNIISRAMSLRGFDGVIVTHDDDTIALQHSNERKILNTPYSNLFLNLQNQFSNKNYMTPQYVADIHATSPIENIEIYLRNNIQKAMKELGMGDVCPPLVYPSSDRACKITDSNELADDFRARAALIPDVMERLQISKGDKELLQVFTNVLLEVKHADEKARLDGTLIAPTYDNIADILEVLDMPKYNKTHQIADEQTLIENAKIIVDITQEMLHERKAPSQELNAKQSPSLGM